MKACRVSVVAAASLLLAACAILPGQNPVDVYTLPATAGVRHDATRPIALSLRIARPAAGLHLSGRRIVVVPQDNQLGVYQGARWSDPAPVLLRDRLIDAFRSDGTLATLISDEHALSADYELKSDLLAFQSEYRDGQPQAIIRLDALLVHAVTGRVVASRRFETQQAVTGTQVPAVVAAFGTAGDALAGQLVAWTTTQLRDIPQSR